MDLSEDSQELTQELENLEESERIISFTRTNDYDLDPESFFSNVNSEAFADLTGDKNTVDTTSHLITKPDSRTYFCHNEIVILLDISLSDVPGAPTTKLNSIYNHLTQNKRHQFICCVHSLPVSQTIEFRRIERPNFERENSMFYNLDAETLRKAVVELFLIVPIHINDIVSFLRQNKLESFCRRLLAIHSGKQITILIIGMERWKKCNIHQKDQIENLENTIVWLQLESGCHFHEAETNVSAAAFVEIFAESVAESLYNFTFPSHSIYIMKLFVELFCLFFMI